MSTNEDTAEVRLTIPANGAYVAVPRAVVGNLAAHDDFTLDAIDDLRIAVDEACALLLPHATDNAVECVFTVSHPRWSSAIVRPGPGRLASRHLVVRVDSSVRLWWTS